MKKLIYILGLCFLINSTDSYSQSSQIISNDISLECPCKLHKTFDEGNIHYKCIDESNGIMVHIILRSWSNFFDKNAVKEFNKSYMSNVNSFREFDFMNSKAIEGTFDNDGLTIKQLLFFSKPSYNSKVYDNITLSVYCENSYRGNIVYKSIKESIRYR